MFARFLSRRSLSRALCGVTGAGLLLSGCSASSAEPSPSVEAVAPPSVTPSPSVAYVSQMTQEERYVEAERVVRTFLGAVFEVERTAGFLPPPDAVVEYTAGPFRAASLYWMIVSSERDHAQPVKGDVVLEVRADRDYEAPDGVVRVAICKDARGVQFFDENGDPTNRGNLVAVSYNLVVVDGRMKIAHGEGKRVEECSLDS